MQKLNVAMIGTGFMGKAHSLAYAAMPAYFWPAPAIPVRKVVVDVTDDLATTARDRFGFERCATDWRVAVADREIDIVDICTPNDSHAEIAIAAAKAGKHIMCEKPLARTAPEAKTMLDAVEASGVTNMVAFNYRHTPAVAFARKLIDEGRIGRLLNFRGHYLSDWAADPLVPLAWRFQKQIAGSGTIGDIGSHIIDMARYLVGEIEALNAVVRTYIHERPEQIGAFDKLGTAERRPDAPKRAVDVDDEVLSLLRFSGGVPGSIEATRNAYGRGNYLGFEVHGSAGSIVFNYERMNELKVLLADDPPELRGFRPIYTGPVHPHGEALWPVPAIGIGYLDLKVIKCHEFIKAIVDRAPASPSFRDGYRIARICDALIESGERKDWVEVPA
jgi:predicted dehydrogenase